MTADVVLDVPRAERNERGQITALYHVGAIGRPRGGAAGELTIETVWECGHRHRLVAIDPETGYALDADIERIIAQRHDAFDCAVTEFARRGQGFDARA